VDGVRAKRVPNAGRVRAATPDDVVILSLSTHGLVNENGGFCLLPQEARAGAGGQGLASQCISSDELSEWLREVDAGSMVMIIDACHSAAATGADFKPGPLGARGLGQLAYDKGMQILVASQAASVALESSSVQHGLLTYALVREGIEEGQGDWHPRDGLIRLVELLEFAAQRVPRLQQDIDEGRIKSRARDAGGARGVVVVMDPDPQDLSRKPDFFQQPLLFSFGRRNRADLILVPHAGTTR
jgi:uncharacterized caspase-like protein